MTTYLHSYAFVTPIHSIPCITRLIVQVKWWVHLSSMLPCFFFILTHILRSIFPKQTFSLYFVHLVKNAQNALFLRSPLWAFQKNFFASANYRILRVKDKWPRLKASEWIWDRREGSRAQPFKEWYSLKEISPEYSLEGLMLKLKLQYFGHLMWRTDSFEKTLMPGKIEGGRRRRWQRMR